MHTAWHKGSTHAETQSGVEHTPAAMQPEQAAEKLTKGNSSETMRHGHLLLRQLTHPTPPHLPRHHSHALRSAAMHTTHSSSSSSRSAPPREAALALALMLGSDCGDTGRVNVGRGEVRLLGLKCRSARIIACWARECQPSGLSGKQR